VQLSTSEKFEYLIRGERKIFANREDYFPIGGLHWETDSHSMLAQLVDGLHDVVGSLCEIGHNELSKRKRHHCGNGGARLVARTACAQVLHSFSTLLAPTIHAKISKLLDVALDYSAFLAAWAAPIAKGPRPFTARVHHSDTRSKLRTRR